jgi:orotate phosphoribosyltransferase/AMMECR1 domain-containing protein
MLREALSNTLASLPEDFHSARAELLDMLRSRGILYQSPTQPILSRDGTSSRWMLNSLAVTLSPRGAELAGRCLLKLLERFDGRQIATYGLTGVPILQSCLLQSNGRYHGLLVRKERKQHGSLKLIEGEIDPNEPVILIDDSVSSGTCMQEGTERLEQAGLRVEGGVCLVRFGWYGGYALMQERGYHMEAVYDIWDDFIAHMADEEPVLVNPTKWFPSFRWADTRAPEKLHPAKLARMVISKYLSSGELLRPPERLDEDYDSSGGAWVSIRSQSNIHQRHARDGFWHFPGEEHESAARDVVLASLRTAHELPHGEEGLQALDQSGIAVTFFSALEQCTPGQLDNDCYGIVVRSLERPQTMGGALPRMPGIRNEWEQFQHARIKNAQLVFFEPYALFRHDVVKVVEPEMVWQPTGVGKGESLAWCENPEICGVVVGRARDIVLAQLFAQPETTVELPNDLLPGDVESLYLTIYIGGQLSGCMGSAIRNLDADLKKLAEAALHDDRFSVDQPNDPDAVAVSASVLFNPLEMGAMMPDEVGPYYRHGDQTLMVYQGNDLGLLLPFVATMYNLDRTAFAEAVRQKSGLSEPPYYWCRFDCATWLADSEGVWPTAGGFPSRDVVGRDESLDCYARLHARYLLKHLRPDGSLYSDYEPFQNRLYEGVYLPRLAHAAWVLARYQKIFGGDDLKDAADRAIEYLLGTVTSSGEEVWLKSGDEVPSVAEVSLLLLALCELPASDPRRSLVKKLARPLWSSIQLPHGRILTHGQNELSSDDAYQDYFPGQVLLALATAVDATATEFKDQSPKTKGLSPDNLQKLNRSFQYYRHRYRYKRNFGQVAWLLQAFSKWWHVTHEDRFAELVFEIADWVLGYQQEKTGAFINDHQVDSPGYTTGVYLEGLAAAMGVAASLEETTIGNRKSEIGNPIKNEDRYRKYHDSFIEGFRFLDRLIIQKRDRSILPNMDFALGGLRQGIHYSSIRTDFVQHSLSALLEFTSQQREVAKATVYL